MYKVSLFIGFVLLAVFFQPSLETAGGPATSKQHTKAEIKTGAEQTENIYLS